MQTPERAEHTELVLAGIVTMASAGIIFAAGYLLGRQHGVHQSLHQLMPLSLGDALYARVSMSDRRGFASVLNNLASDASETSPVDEGVETSIGEEEGCTDTEVSSPEDRTQYQAILAGYGTYEGADRYAQALKKRGISVIIRARAGTHKGRPRTWYQVLTSPDSKDKTQQLVSVLQKVDRLYDVVLESVDAIATV